MNDGLLILILVVLLPFLIIAFALILAVATTLVMYLIAMYTALRRVSSHNRMVQPWQIWLTLIPVLGALWHLLIAVGIPESFRNEFRDRGEDDGSDYGKKLGIGVTILLVANMVLGCCLTQVSGRSRGVPRRLLLVSVREFCGIHPILAQNCPL